MSHAEHEWIVIDCRGAETIEMRRGRLLRDRPLDLALSRLPIFILVTGLEVTAFCHVIGSHRDEIVALLLGERFRRLASYPGHVGRNDVGGRLLRGLVK